MHDARSSFGGRRQAVTLLAACLIAAGLLGGCPVPDDDDVNGGNSGGGAVDFNNTTDPTNNGAHYIGSDACSACHPDFAAIVNLHGHTYALNRVEGQPPQFPAAATRADVPNPPAGFTWPNISYVVSGYLHSAFFLGNQGYILTTGATGADTKWLLSFPPIERVPHFVPYFADRSERLPFEYDSCFRCHTTGPVPFDPNDPRYQDGRTGIRGTWSQPGVHCEACHGPGSNHAPNPEARNLFVDSSAKTCGNCHTNDDDPNVIPVVNGLLGPNSQYPQLLASGGHSAFSCGVCHDPHASITYDRELGWRNQCSACHCGQNLAFHEGKVFHQGDYTETLSCLSCHMPPAGVDGAPVALAGGSAVGASPDVVGSARVGDVSAHVFHIDTVHTYASEIISADGTQLLKNDQGVAGLTVEYVCLRCHNEKSEIFPLRPDGAVQIARDIHARAANGGDADVTGTAKPKTSE